MTGVAVSRASSYGGSDLADAGGLKSFSPPGDAGGGHRGGGGGQEPRAVPVIEPMDIDGPLSRPASPFSTLSGASSRADSEMPTASPSNRGRRGGGFLGLGALFGRSRWQAKPEQPPPPELEHQVPPTIDEDSVAAVPELRRSFSEPAVISRRGALELRREVILPVVHRGFAMAGADDEGNDDEAGPSTRRSREVKRSSGESLRSKSEPASRTRDSRRRRNFYMEEASYDDHFINPDLETRAQIFNSEEQLFREDEQYDFTMRSR
jgi:hypothetical protein